MPRWPWLLALAYFLGALPTGAVVARAHGLDLTQYGSRRTGATNALRVLGKRAGALVLVGDALKGVAAVALARRWGGGPWAPPLAAMCAMLGHSYSIFLGGKGGRGVATGLGALGALSPAALGAAAVAGGGAIAATRYVSLGSLVGALVGGATLARQAQRGRVPRSYRAFAVGGAAFLVFTHRDNVERLLSRTERRLGESVRSGDEW
jgi:acyl phosphate:glycerol-3-phosphate acyltransferase